VPEIQEAVSLAQESAYTREELEAYESYWDAISTEKTLLSEKYAEGLAEREAKLAERIIKIAKNLLAQGIPLEAVSQAAGLSLAALKKLE